MEYLDSKLVQTFINNMVREFELKYPDDLLTYYLETNDLEELDSSLYNSPLINNQEVLDEIMNRLLQRGKERFGPKRAFLFARQMHCNIDIPMQYGIDYFDPELRIFINAYLKAMGNKNLICFSNYFTRTSIYDPLIPVTISQLLQNRWNTIENKYTYEEIQLYQKLTNILNEHINTLTKKKN